MIKMKHLTKEKILEIFQTLKNHKSRQFPSMILNMRRIIIWKTTYDLSRKKGSDDDFVHFKRY